VGQCAGSQSTSAFGDTWMSAQSSTRACVLVPLPWPLSSLSCAGLQKQGNFTIAGSFGDQFSDLSGIAPAAASFKLPNPVRPQWIVVRFIMCDQLCDSYVRSSSSWPENIKNSKP